jgi:gephyrin
LAGAYPVQSRVRAGDAEELELQPGQVVYITTGARVPPGADAVVKIEETSAMGAAATAGEDEERVHIDVSVPLAGMNVRQVGSDMAVGELLLSAGQLIGAAEVGMLATAGVLAVQCFRRPVVGVLSTGSELVDPLSSAPLSGSQVRDSNRVALLAALKADGYDALDLGIVGDTEAALRAKLLEAVALADVLITSGGVSMGDADLVKPMLAELGTVHFGRLNMKPGKPTTFATVPRAHGRGKALVFGLPGNPSSCLVAKALFVDPCLRRLQGDSSQQCLHTQMQAALAGGALRLDPERAEYHRGVLQVHAGTGAVTVRSTGNQRSSRLLSMRASNCLICLPQGPGTVAEGAQVTALLTSSAVHSVLPPPQDGKLNAHRQAALLDETDSSAALAGVEADGITSLQSLGDLVSPKLESLAPATAAAASPAAAAAAAAAAATGNGKIPMRVGLLTISDRASAGTYADASGPEMAKLLLGMEWPLLPTVAHTACVPDEPSLIRQKMMEWIDSESIGVCACVCDVCVSCVCMICAMCWTNLPPPSPDLLLTSGGTGFGQRDCTPEAVRPMLHREAPGIAQALLNEGLKHTPLAVLSRPVAGTRGACFVATLPGSVKAVRENIRALQPLLPRIMELIIRNTCDHAAAGGVATMCDCCK